MYHNQKWQKLRQRILKAAREKPKPYMRESHKAKQKLFRPEGYLIYLSEWPPSKNLQINSGVGVEKRKL